MTAASLYPKGSHVGKFDRLRALSPLGRGYSIKKNAKQDQEDHMQESYPEDQNGMES